MAYYKFQEKKYWESSNLTKINPSRENHAHFISCKPPYKTTLESTLGLHFDSFKSQHQLVRNLKFYQLHFIWVPLYIDITKQPSTFLTDIEYASQLCWTCLILKLFTHSAVKYWCLLNVVLSAGRWHHKKRAYRLNSKNDLLSGVSTMVVSPILWPSPPGLLVSFQSMFCNLQPQPTQQPQSSEQSLRCI